MTVFDWPRAWQPMAGKFGLYPIGHSSTSPYTGSVKNIYLTSVWHAELTFNNHTLADGIDIQGFIESLEGGQHTVRLFDPWRGAPRASGAVTVAFTDGTMFDDGTGFVDGWNGAGVTVSANAAKGATSISISGLPASAACFVRGDLFNINGSLYQARVGVTADGSGNAVMSIQPSLRAGIAAGDPLNTYYPTCQMRLMNAGDMLSREFNISTGFTLQFAEDIQ